MKDSCPSWMFTISILRESRLYELSFYCIVLYMPSIFCNNTLTRDEESSNLQTATSRNC